MTAPLLKKVVEEDNNANNPFGTTMAMAPGFDENVAVIEDLLASPPSAGSRKVTSTGADDESSRAASAQRPAWLLLWLSCTGLRSRAGENQGSPLP